MSISDMWNIGQGAMAAAEDLDQRGRSRSSAFMEGAGLFCLALTVASTLQAVWNAAERKGLRRGNQAATFLGGLGRQDAGVVAQRAYLAAWGEASQYYREPVPPHIAEAWAAAEAQEQTIADQAGNTEDDPRARFHGQEPDDPGADG